MADPATWLAIGTIVAVAGAGVSAYGQHQQGKAQNAIAQMNAMNAERQAKMQLMASQTQAELQKRDAETNFMLRVAEAKARENNAKAIESTVVQQDSVNRMNLRKRREEFGRMQASQRASIAASGVAESTGTPLDLIAETASKIAQDQTEQGYIAEVQRRTLLNEASMERFGGKMALAGATLDRDSGVAAAALNAAAGKGEYLGNLRGAEITRLTGRAAQRNANYGATATLLNNKAGNLSTVGGMNFKRS